MPESYEFPAWQKILGVTVTLLMFAACFFFAHEAYATSHSAGTKVFFGVLGFLGGIQGVWMTTLARRLADRITVSEVEIVRTSPSGNANRMAWSEVRRTTHSVAFQYLELWGQRDDHRMRLEYSIDSAGSLIDSIAARTKHLADNVDFPFIVDPQNRPVLLAFWIPPVIFTLAMIVALPGISGWRELLVGATLWFCVGLTAWLFGVQRIVVDQGGVTISRRAHSRRIPISDVRSIRLRVVGGMMKSVSLELVLRDSQVVQLSYHRVDKFLIYHLITRLVQEQRDRPAALLSPN